MFRAYVLKRDTILKFAVFMAVVALLAWYANSKREEFKRSLMRKDDVVPALGGRIAEKEEEGGSKPSGAAVERGEGAAAVGGRAADGRMPAAEFFFASREERDRAYAMEAEVLRQVIQDPDADPSVRSEANERLLALMRNLASEKRAEEVIRGRGFDDVVVFSTLNGATVIVKAPALDRSQATQIGESVVEALGVAPENVNIVTRQ